MLQTTVFSQGKLSNFIESYKEANGDAFMRTPEDVENFEMAAYAESLVNFCYQKQQKSSLVKGARAANNLLKCKTLFSDVTPVQLDKMSNYLQKVYEV